ncbi:MAG: 7TM diverse intracellular signaling domain-containing protein [bacterium]
MSISCICLSSFVVAASGPSAQWDKSWEMLPAERATTLIQAQRSSGWSKGTGTASFSYDSQPKWLRYRLPPADHGRAFSIENPWLAAIDVYTLDDGVVVHRFEMGNRRPAAERPIGSTNFAVGIRANIDEIYIYDHARSASYFPVTLASAAQFTASSTRLTAFHGMYYGGLLIIILYNLAIFFGTRDSAYLYYTLYAGCLMGFLSTADGTGALFLWSESPRIQDYVLGLGWGLGFIWLLEFASRFLNTSHIKHCLVIRRGIQGLTALTMLIVISRPGNDAYVLQTIMSFIVLSALLFIGINTSLKGIRNGRLFLAANGVFAIGSFSHMSMLMGWLAPHPMLQHGVHIGSLAELILLAAGLVRHLRANEQARFAAFNQSQELVRRNHELRTASALAEEHRQLQKSLQQAQKLKTIGQLAGGFAHDFNNILASILGFAELARDKTAASDRATLLRYLSEIQQSGERGANLVKQLLTYSRNTSSTPRELDLGQTLEASGELLRGSLPATVNIQTHIPAQSVRLSIDPEQLQQVMVNLSINAAEAMQNRGQIDIYLEEEALQGARCTSCLARFQGDYIAIKIEDNGAGISGNAEKLFTPFQTSKAVGQGTGLGLSVVHGIVHEHGGHVHASNRATGGARFTIYLPHSTPVTSGADEKQKRILLIEDDPSVASYLQSLFADEAYHTTFASMPTEALETFVANPDAFDLVITDYLMPQGTGLELAEDIHALRPDLPILLTTGNANNLDKSALTAAELAGIFEKPLNSDQLLAKIRGLLAT